ncbi:MAG: DUF4981 domain-containing protein [Clostridiales bacterium]|nr:DUF4981 domain-containing protein [Clostridiales bacterium]
MEFKAYHKDLNTLHICCEKPRAYFIPFADERSSVMNRRDESPFFINLCGEWGFTFYESFEDVEADFFNVETYGKISVPCCWQTDLDKGYDTPLYSNLFYPFPLDPPYVPAENPCGHYSRTLYLKKNSDKKYYINFEGVSSCFYLFVNGVFAAYSQVSHCTSEIDITDYVISGDNKIDVLVVKWCDGSYLEDQDFFRLSGIFRQVYILERDNKHITDIFIKTQLSSNLDFALIEALIDGTDEYSFKLIDKNENTVEEGKNSIAFTIENPYLWSSEEPDLYTLVVSSGNEVIAIPFGIKKLELRGNVAFFNNKPIKLLGVNRHDNNPMTGYYCSEDDLLKDLKLLKQCNVNTIRTSHYPGDPRFMMMCEKYGFMVVDEADLETHGMGFEYRDTWDWPRWSELSRSEDWTNAYVDRAQRLFERDKNFGCVIMWSLGNESGCGRNHRAMRNYIKSRDPQAVIHYENAHLEFKSVPVGENYSDISDVESRMYSTLDYTREYAEQPESKKPFFWCEYACSMTTGDIHAHVDLIRKLPAMFGGCFWEFSDHAIQVAPGKFRYGGDFGDYPNNYVCCIDGIVFPDRSLRPGYMDLKKAYQPFKISWHDGIMNVFNRNYFAALSVNIRYSLEKNGVVLDSGEIKNVDVAPQNCVCAPLNLEVPKGENVFLTFFVFDNKDGLLTEKGMDMGFDQVNLSSAEETPKSAVLPLPDVREEKRYIFIKADKSEFVFDKSFGRISSFKKSGKEVLNAPTGIELWKAPGYNEFEKAEDLKSANVHKAVQLTKAIKISFEDCFKIECDISVGGPAVVPVINGRLIYSFSGDGSVKITLDADFSNQIKKMNMLIPRIGYVIEMKKEFSSMQYFGKGPFESYPDRHRGTYYSLFETDVDSNFVPYIKPIENGAHFDTKYALISDGETQVHFSSPQGRGFGFNATRFTPYILEQTKHNDELKAGESIYVYLDYLTDIRGGRGIYEKIEPERKYPLEKINFSVIIF